MSFLVLKEIYINPFQFPIYVIFFSFCSEEE